MGMLGGAVCHYYSLIEFRNRDDQGRSSLRPWTFDVFD